MYLLGIDAGTTGCKAMVFDLDGHAVTGSQEYPTYYPQPTWAEHEPEDWWKALVASVRQCLAKVDAAQIAAISVSSHREAVVPIGRDGQVLGRSIIWMDKRSIPQAEWIRQTFGDAAVYRKAGVRPDPTFTATKLLWLKEHQPDLLARTAVFLQPKDFLVWRLTGEQTTDYSVASRTLLFNVSERRWDEELFRWFGLDQSWFPRLVRSEEIVGQVTAQAAAETGLRPGTPVVGGGGDRPCEALGAGAIEPDIIEESTGSATTAAMTLDRPFIDLASKLSCGCHVIPGQWCLEAGTGVSGAVLRWCRDELALLEKETAVPMHRRAYELMDMQAELLPPGSNGLLVVPHFMGSKAPHWNPQARGTIFGLTLLHGRQHIAKAIMEGVAYELRYLFEVLAAAGVQPQEIRLQGGASKSPTWSQIKADVWGRRVTMLEFTDGACLGDAILAGLGIGVFQDYREGVERLVHVKRTLDPDPAAHAVYDRLYAVYRDVATTLDPHFARLQEVTLTERLKETPWEEKVHLLDFV